MITTLWCAGAVLGLVSAVQMGDIYLATRLLVCWPLMSLIWGLVLLCLYVMLFEWWLKDVSPWFEIKGKL